MDIALTYDFNPFLSDILISGYDLKTGEDLKTAIEMSLFTNRRANPDDTLPYPGADKQGWWGDTYAQQSGDLIGSRLWELIRNINSSETALQATAYVNEALAWLVTDKVVASFTVSCKFIAPSILGIEIDITKPTGDGYHFNYVWDQLKNG